MRACRQSTCFSPGDDIATGHRSSDCSSCPSPSGCTEEWNPSHSRVRRPRTVDQRFTTPRIRPTACRLWSKRGRILAKGTASKLPPSAVACHCVGLGVALDMPSTQDKLDPGHPRRPGRSRSEAVMLTGDWWSEVALVRVGASQKGGRKSVRGRKGHCLTTISWIELGAGQSGQSGNSAPVRLYRRALAARVDRIGRARFQTVTTSSAEPMIASR